MANTNKATQKVLHLVYGDCTLGVHGDNFNYIFSYTRGGMESLVMDGKEWLYRVPKPTFWRATTDNDRGHKFHLRSGSWMSADMFIYCTNIELSVDGQKIENAMAPENNAYSNNETAETVKITFRYNTITTPAASVDVSYDINSDGDIKVSVNYEGNAELPEFPVFGMRFIAPTKATGYRYEGLSDETYPDRMAGGIPGVYEIEGLPVTKYIVPQDCNMHMQNEWLEVYRNTTLASQGTQESFGLRFSKVGEPFAFSCIPYTPQELESATHHEELPAARRTVIGIYGAVRGVGGINSWGADVEPPYRVDASKDISYSFTISRATNPSI